MRWSPRRRRTRSSERGASIFIVVLVITLLTTVGIFAARNASQINIASGHARQATQALYFAEMATELGIAHIDGPQAGKFINLTYESEDRATNACRVTGGAASAPCYRIVDADVLERVQKDISGATLYEKQSETAPGSFGPALPRADVTTGIDQMNYSREGVFVVELTDPFEGLPPKGYNIDDSAFRAVKVNVTGFAQIRTAPNTSITDEWCGNTVTARTATIMAVRGYVTLPLVPR